MLKGWFDAFRTEGGPTLYAASNRTAVTEDIRNIIIYVSFSTLFLAFLIVFPGIRKERLSTFISVTISLLVGAVILISIYGSDWHVATAMVSSPYRAFSSDRISARVGVHIGLNSVNITLQATPRYSDSEEINFNEKFTWFGPTQIQKDYREALVKGLPFPILTIAEYLSQDLEGFCWGRRYRLAGYYAFALLWTAFALWLLMNVLLCAVPRYGAYAMQLTGALMLLSNAIYTLLMPRKPLVIPFQGGLLRFSFGWCFWAVMGAGGIAVLCGALVAVLDVWFPNKFSTILEVDYDTPYRYFVGQDYIDRKPSTVASQLGTKMNVVGPEPSSSSQATELESSDGIVNAAYEDSDDGSVIIDGKRAVSLHNFGKYAAKEERRRSLQPASSKLSSRERTYEASEC
ncbi:dual oxidase maturation factor 2 isoform X3 [Ixodes scapularis]|uniref:dual oxidase maturation factor 2 isoform X3 n=1 Tax=Ixodes scapularis TaxID=6945 RepID=UPI001161A289|nr:dual oxidase maturation factor 2 isoform X3 [Ixodes scapularis]